MDIFFNPASVVVIGASNTPFNLGATICRSIKHYSAFPGPVYAVNRKGEAVHDCPGYMRVADIPGPVDLAVIIAPAAVVPDFVRQCGAKGIRHIVIESSGFSEGGSEGLVLQQEIDAAAKAAGIRILGPNCLGVLNTRNRFCCFYGVQEADMTQFTGSQGGISYIIQSGGIGVIILESLLSDVVGANKIVSIGNKCDIDEADMIAYFDADPTTEVIGMYLEGIRDGRKLIETARRVRKPLLAFKVGRTAEGARAAMSHTAGMANNDRIFECACRQAGIIRAASISELHSLPKVFMTMPPLKGRRIVVFTNSGAFGGIAADLLIAAGLAMARLSPPLQERLRATGQIFNAANPIDLGPAISMQTYQAIFDILLASGEVDGILAIPSLWHPMVIEAIGELIRKCRIHGTPAAVYTPNAVEKTIAYRKAHQVPLFESPEEAVRALAASHQHYRFLSWKEAGAQPTDREDEDCSAMGASSV